MANKDCAICGTHMESVHYNKIYCDSYAQQRQRERSKIANKARYHANIEESRRKNNEYRKRYYATNKQKMRKQAKAKRDKNREQLREQGHQNYRKHRAKHKKCVVCGTSLFLQKKQKYCKNCTPPNLLKNLKALVGCERCGNRDYRVLQFHHVDPVNKLFKIESHLSIEQIKSELPKCIVLCANCHIKEHYIMRESA